MDYALDMGTPSEILGIMSDSHGNNELLIRAIRTLKELGAEKLFHLGDLCDSLRPDRAAEAIKVISEHHILAVRGNNECMIIHDRGLDSVPRIENDILSSLNSLPYSLNIGSYWFTHSAPYSHPAATRRPISEFLPGLISDPTIPFSILFRGHSHRASIIEIQGQTMNRIKVERDVEIQLEKNRRYIITTGAVEKSLCLLFRPEDYSVRFVTLPA